MINKYYGDKKITALDEVGKTPMGADIYQVHLEDSEEVIYETEPALKDIVTDKARTNEDKTIQQSKVEGVAKRCLALMSEANIKSSEANHLLELIAMSINNNFDSASNILWNITNPLDRSMLSADSIIKGNGPTEY